MIKHTWSADASRALSSSSSSSSLSPSSFSLSRRRPCRGGEGGATVGVWGQLNYIIFAITHL